MRLSEAILLGSIGTEQSFVCGGMNWKQGRSCALGAALCAIGGENWNDVIKEWPWVRENKIHHSYYAPLFDRVYDETTTIEEAIWSLNDIGRWPRPKIAAWVAEQEVKLGIVDTEVKQEVVEVENAPA